MTLHRLYDLLKNVIIPKTIFTAYREPKQMLIYRMSKKFRSLSFKKYRRNKRSFDQSLDKVSFNPIISDNNVIKDSAETCPNIAIIFKSELDYISRCILDYTKIETGGQLFGYWTAEDIPVILYALGPGPKANHEVAFFNQDIDYLKRVGYPLIERFGLQHIGEWHSHHQLGLAQPSTHDAHTMMTTIREKHLKHFLLCIGNCNGDSSTLNAFNFVEENDDYAKAQWCIKDIESPFRKIIDDELRTFLVHPNTPIARHGYIYSVGSTSTEVPIEYKPTYWFNKKENRLILKKIMDYLSSIPIMGKCSIQLDENNFVNLSVATKEYVDQIFFPERFPDVAPKITRIRDEKIFENVAYPWNPEGDIYNDFIKYYFKTIEI